MRWGTRPALLQKDRAPGFLIGALVLLAVPLTAAYAEGAAMPQEFSLTLPRSVDAWTRADAPQHVGPADIFKYMDGAGELYLGYRFRFLEAWEYKNPAEDGILVELYWMESSDDAYGLLSGDWGGEAVDLAPSASGSSSSAGIDGPRALYGSGLLRLWSGNLYARVMAERENNESKKAVEALGQAIAGGRPAPPRPALIRALPSSVGSQFYLRPSRVTFLRSHLVLNSVYFLSSENLLDLGPECEVVALTYGQDPLEAPANAKPARLLLARYANKAAAEKALRHFREIYLREKLNGPKTSLIGDNGVVAIEDGWTGFARSGRGLALVFECPDEASARLFLSDFTRFLEKLEASHE